MPNLSRLRNKIRGLPDAVARVFSRVVSRVVGLWSTTSDRFEAEGATLDRNDSWLQWKIGQTEKHCSDCLHLNGQIHRASEWAAAGIKPQSPDLECGGWHCDCRFEKIADYSGDGEGTLDPSR